MRRRKFFENTAFYSMGALGTVAVMKNTIPISLPVPQGLNILFQGDSITDAGRNRGNYYANVSSGMGGGYVYQIVAELLGANPGADLQCYNRGISGNKVFQLAERWNLDCLAIKPDVLSILIGVNDYWHMINGEYDGTVEIFERDYRVLLQRTIDALPHIKLIIGEPFAVEGGTSIDENWKAFDDYREAARRVANEFSAAFIPYHEIFMAALAHAPASYWCPDGVHPSLAGAHLMKDAWLRTFDDMVG